jgi:hypothetical protein
MQPCFCLVLVQSATAGGYLSAHFHRKILQLDASFLIMFSARHLIAFFSIQVAQLTSLASVTGRASRNLDEITAGDTLLSDLAGQVNGVGSQLTSALVSAEETAFGGLFGNPELKYSYGQSPPAYPSRKSYHRSEPSSINRQN